MTVTKSRAAYAALVLILALHSPARGGVIPLPAKIVPGDGSFEIDSATAVKVPHGDAQAENAAAYLVEFAALQCADVAGVGSRSGSRRRN